MSRSKLYVPRKWDGISNIKTVTDEELNIDFFHIEYNNDSNRTIQYKIPGNITIKPVIGSKVLKVTCRGTKLGDYDILIDHDNHFNMKLPSRNRKIGNLIRYWKTFI